jgi:hypothetical protein
MFPLTFWFMSCFRTTFDIMDLDFMFFMYFFVRVTVSQCHEILSLSYRVVSGIDIDSRVLMHSILELIP